MIDNSPWTKQEDKQLLALAKEHKAFDWQKVATDLGTNRTAWQCFRRYQRSLNSNMMKSKWTPEEDELLRKAVKECGDKNWQQVRAPAPAEQPPHLVDAPGPVVASPDGAAIAPTPAEPAGDTVADTAAETPARTERPS